eukprot:GHVO01039024.1.p1 GENE.GHVO01039024.1~~GHVO01039024.1.p1  ORF type:complete len:165 (+),score=42.65 GHVO01039024.1:29-496(+)
MNDRHDYVPSVDSDEFSLLKNLAVSICMDLYRSPYCLDYTHQEIAAACVWKASVALRLPSVGILAVCNMCNDIMTTTTTGVEEATDPPPLDAKCLRKRSAADSPPSAKRFKPDTIEWTSIIGGERIGTYRLHALLNRLRALYDWMAEIANRNIGG